MSLAVAVGGTVGVGILRLPGQVAAHLGDPRLILAAWVLGGVYAILGVFAVSELAAMLPSAGGFYVYARRAFGPRVGFLVGCSDWLANVAGLGIAALTSAHFLGVLLPPAARYTNGLALLILLIFTSLHWLGVRVGGRIQSAVSAAVGVMLVVLALACFTVPAASAVAPGALPDSVVALPLGFMMVVAASAAMRSVIVTYDGWYSSIYLAEETTHATHNVPQAMLLCVLLATGIYVLINAGFLHALSLTAMASSTLPAAEAAAAVFPGHSTALITVVALVTTLGGVNLNALTAPRILFALGRDGFAPSRAAQVAVGGTPRFALLASSLAAAILLSSGTFEQVLSLSSVVFVLNYLSAYFSVFRLRRTESTLARPYRTWGHPWSTAAVIAGSLAYLASVVVGDPRAALSALGLIAVALVVYQWRWAGRAVSR